MTSIAVLKVVCLAIVFILRFPHFSHVANISVAVNKIKLYIKKEQTLMSKNFFESFPMVAYR